MSPNSGSKEVHPPAPASEEGPSLLTTRTAADLQWTANSRSTTETQSFHVCLENGDMWFLQLVYNSLALSPALQAFARGATVDSQGKAKAPFVHHGAHFSVGASTFSADKRSVQLSPTVFFKQSEVATNATGGTAATSDASTTSPPTIRYTVHLVFSKTALRMTFDALTPAVAIGNGRLRVHTDDHYVAMSFIPAGRVTFEYLDVKTLAVKGAPLAGTATFMHQYQSTRSNLLVGSWHTGILLQPTLAPGQHHPDTLLLSECITPTSHVSAMQGIWVSNGTIKAVFARGGEQALATELDPVSGYSPATKYTMRWQGATLAGEPCTITVRGERPKADACVNMLGELPFLLRKIVQALVAKPYSYMYVDGGVKAEVECAGVKSVIEGTFYRESTFVNKA